MFEVHTEPYVYLPALSHEAALIAWGAFPFRVRQRGAFKFVEPEAFGVRRRDAIGARSAAYGPARVDLFDSRGDFLRSVDVDGANHCWLRGLAADTEYNYTVSVDGERWAGDTRWDWSVVDGTLRQLGEHYVHRFRTFPDPLRPSGPFTFAVLGDIGVGIRRASRERQQAAIGTALRRAVEREGVRFVLTTGDNIYTSRHGFPPAMATDEHDDDCFFSYYQPYRYILDRVPVFPAIGTHDATEGGQRDDREQVEEQFYIHERMLGAGDVAAASVGPGLFYRFSFGSEVEFVCLDTSREEFFSGHRLFDFPEHRRFVEASLAVRRTQPRWRIPFAHHPPFSAGPTYYNTREMANLIPLFERAGVRVMFSGHEHNFQHSTTAAIDYFVSGAAARLREVPPDRFADARTDSWSSDCHFLLVTIDGDVMSVRAIGGLTAPHLELQDIERYDAEGQPRRGPIEVRLRRLPGRPFTGRAGAALPTPPEGPSGRRPRRPGRPR